MPFETEQDFRTLVEPHRGALQAHCYRMLGSLHDAEDITQEAMLRAWNRRQSFEGRSSLKTWLHKIATNACLDALDQRKPRSLPAELGPAARPGQPPDAPVQDPIWLTPAPDSILAASEPGPEARYSLRESVALAFLVALQLLPPKQRAVLLLRDVLGWHADEVAEALGLTVAAANSALQRARETVEAGSERKETAMAETPDEGTLALLTRYMRAWVEADHAALVGLLHEEVTAAMPPMPTWYQGRESVGLLLGQLLAGDGRGRFRMQLISANGQPAMATYQRDATGIYRPFGIQLLDLSGDRIRGMVSFLDPTLFRSFGLPETIA